MLQKFIEMLYTKHLQQRLENTGKENMKPNKNNGWVNNLTPYLQLKAPQMCVDAEVFQSISFVNCM